ncbi:lysozyme [Rouxiella sp. WC2420]|uniref:Lysozyme n=1 Tax=Rouxiella sp. WC2420 TaxID=3234145 RepID=A0AB39VWV9_9GAMM
MNISPAGVELIKQFEGCKLNAYQDSVGIWTIGYGHTLHVEPYDVITGSTAVLMLLDDLKPVEHALHTLVLQPITQNQFDALCSFIFNLGIKAFGGSTLLKKFNISDYSAAADEISKWNKAGGQPLAGLTHRRQAERSLFLQK